MLSILLNLIPLNDFALMFENICNNSINKFSIELQKIININVVVPTIINNN